MPDAVFLLPAHFSMTRPREVFAGRENQVRDDLNQKFVRRIVDGTR